MKWKVKPRVPASFLKQFPEYSPLVGQLLYNRGLKSQAQIDEFFNPDFLEDLHDPFLLKGMKKAVKRVLRAVEKEEKIIIYGDYDADGVCATAILFLTLKSLGFENLDSYIPDREKENHGLSKESIKKLARSRAKLIITVDCASRDLEEVDLANSLGLDVIITDHHELGDKLPSAVALINPLREDGKYPFRDLAGAAVAYKLACALLSTQGNKSADYLRKWLLDLVALATVADVMPLVGENRTLVKYGLAVLAQTRWLGLQELMKLAQVDIQISQPAVVGQAPPTNLDTYTLGYILGPRLNAAGRMDHANNALQLLITQDRKEARELAERLNRTNLTRQSLTDKIVREVINRLEKKIVQGQQPKLIFEGSSDWPVGLIGLVAGRISGKYCRPTFIYCEKKGAISVSARTVPQFDLIEAIESLACLLENFGGHKKAAGFQMKKSNLKKVKEIFQQLAEEELKEEDLVPQVDIDMELSLEDINWPNYEAIRKFAPFGQANPQPKFLARELEVKDARIVGNNGKHLKMELMIFDNQSSRVKSFKAIGFNLGQWQDRLKVGDSIDMVFELIVDEWNGHRDLQLKIIDIKALGI